MKACVNGRMIDSEEITVELGVYDIVITYTITEDGDVDYASIESNLHEDGEPEFNNAMDGIESLILAQFCSGVDVTDYRYIEGLESAIQGIADNI